MARPFARIGGGKSRVWANAGKLPAHVETILDLLRDRRPTRTICEAILSAGVDLLSVPKALAFVRFCDCATGATRRTFTIDDAYAENVLPDTFNGITGRALRTGKPQLVGDVRKDPDYVPLATGTRSELAVPLLLGGACYGVINFESPARDAFTAAQLPWVQLLAQFAALAELFEDERGVHDSELLRGGTRKTDSIYLRTLDKALDGVITALGGDRDPRDLMAEVMMAVPHSDQLVTLRLRPNTSIAMHIRLRAGEGIAGRVLQTGQPFGGDTPYDDPESRGRAIGEITHLHTTRSALAVPLRASGGTIVGLLTVESPRAGALGPDALDALNREGLPAMLASQLAQLQRETLTPEAIVEDLLDTLELQIAFAIDPADLSGGYYQILQVAARIVGAPEVSAGLILARDEAQSLVSVTPDSERKGYAVRVARLGVFNTPLEWRLDANSITRRVLESGRTANTGDVRRDPEYLETDTGYAESSELIVALPEDHHPIGVIVLVSPRLNAFSAADERAVERVARLAAVAIMRAEVIREARHRRAQLDAASDLLKMLHPLFPADEARLLDVDIDTIRRRVYDRILELATSKTGAEYGVIVLAEKTQSGVPNLVIKRERSSEQVSGASARRSTGEGAAGLAYRSGTRVNSSTTRGQAQAQGQASGSEIRFVPYFASARSELAVPMKRGDAIVGVIDIESSRPSHFTSAQVQWAEFLAEQAAFALAAVDLVLKSKIEMEFARLSQRIDRELISMRALDATGIRGLRNRLLRDVLDLTCRVTDSAIGRVLVAMNVYPVGDSTPDDQPDLENGRFLRMVSTEPREGPDAEDRYFPANAGVASVVLREKRAVFFNDEDARPEEFFTNTGRQVRSGMFMPILEGVRVVGVLDIESEREDAFSEDGIATTQRASELVSKLLANTRLYLRALERKLLRTFETRILLNRSSDPRRFMEEALSYAAQLADIHDLGWGTLVEVRRAESGAGWTAEHIHTMTYASGARKQFESVAGNSSAITFLAFQQALDNQTPVLILDSAELHSALRRAGMPWPARSLICVPLLQPVEDDGMAGTSDEPPVTPAIEPVGVLALASPSPSEFSEADKELLTLFAQTIISGLKSVALLGERANLMREVRHDYFKAFPPLAVYMDTLEDPLEAALAATTLPETRAELQAMKELTAKIHPLMDLVSDLMNWFFDLSNDRLAPETNLANVVNASRIIEILRSPIEVLAGTYKRSVDWQLPAAPLAIIGGERRERLIRAVLFKYLDNAIKYGEEDVVRVSLSADQDFATFAVRSVGQPVPPNERGRIFQLYYRASNVDSSQPGTGIGLFQAREIAKALDGHVGYEALPPRYNVLSLSVPLAERHSSVRRHSS